MPGRNVLQIAHHVQTSFSGHRRILLLALLGIATVIVAINAGLAFYYNDHLLPGTVVAGQSLGNLTGQQAVTLIQNHLADKPLILSFGPKSTQVTPASLGITYDIPRTVDITLHSPRPLLPLLSWLPGQTHIYPLTYTLDSAKLDAMVGQLAKTYATSPTKASIQIANGQPVITPEKPGQHYAAGQVKAQVLAALTYRTTDRVTITDASIAPTITAATLQPALKKVRQLMLLPISLQFQGQTFQPTPAEIGSWLTTDATQQVVVDHDKLSAYVAGIAKAVNQPAITTVITLTNGKQTNKKFGQDGVLVNQEAAVASITQTLTSATPLTYQLTVTRQPAPIEYIRTTNPQSTTYSYCVEGKQIDTSLLDQFSQTIAQTLNDPRGWSLDGQIKFQQVTKGCTFTMWLAAASTLPQFSSGCSTLYSCSVGTNVIINVDPWLNTTPTWQSQHGTLADYRALVINHEVGHWLGFGHLPCPGPNQLAPVMLQQSINLQGCRINSWPTPAELSMLRAMQKL